MKQMIKKLAIVLSVALVCAPMGAMAANKLIVKDATGTIDKMVVTDLGRIAIGHSNPVSAFHIKGSDTGSAQLLNQFTGTTTAAGGGAFMAMHNNAANALPNAGDRIGYFIFGSYDGATQRFGAQLAVYAEEAWATGTSTPTYFTFQTTPSGATVRSERMRITAAGNIGFGTSTPAQKVEVNGGIKLNTATAKPTCDATVTRGTLWFVKGSTGADTLEVCSKDGAGNYAWRALF